MNHNAEALPPSPGHDHRRCVDGAMTAAELHCRRAGARFTTLRRRVLELIWDSHEPVGAYALLDSLRKEGLAAAPPTVYRALDFLLGLGLIHRLQSLNAFVGCPRPDGRHFGQFLLCTHCGMVVELEDAAIAQAVVGGATRMGFVVGRQTVEIEGVCRDCLGKENPSDG